MAKTDLIVIVGSHYGVIVEATPCNFGPGG